MEEANEVQNYLALFSNDDTYFQPTPVSNPEMSHLLTNHDAMCQLVSEVVETLGYEDIIRVGENCHVQLTRHSLDDDKRQSATFALSSKMNNSNQCTLQINTIMCARYTKEQFKVIVLEHEICHLKIFLDPSEIDDPSHEGRWLQLITERNIFHNNDELLIIGVGNRILPDFHETKDFAVYLYQRHINMTGHYPEVDKRNCNDCQYYYGQRTRAVFDYLEFDSQDD